MNIDLSSPIVKISAAATAATLFFSSLAYGIIKSHKCKKLEKEINDLKKVLDDADKALEAETSN